MRDSGSGWLILGLIAAISYGVSEHSRANTLQSQVDDLRSKAETLSAASDNLKEQMERFETESWRDVVPDAKDAAESVDTAKDDLQSSVDEAVSADTGE